MTEKLNLDHFNMGARYRTGQSNHAGKNYNSGLHLNYTGGVNANVHQSQNQNSAQAYQN